MSPSNVAEGIAIDSPRSVSERLDLAEMTCQRLSLALPAAVDDMEDGAEKAYAAWPDRMFVIDRQGIVRYASKHGPYGFRPPELERFLSRYDEGGRRKRRGSWS